MALSASDLSSKMQTNIKNIAGITISNTQELANFCDAMANAVVSEIQTNAVVPAGIAVQVTPSTGTGATTATGTVL